MPLDRFYIDSQLIAGASLSLQDEEAHHLLHVSKVRMGQKVELVNGKQTLATGVLTQVGKGTAGITVEKVISVPPSPFEIILAQALPRINRLDLILEKATELGMTKLLLFPGEKSERENMSPTQTVRMKRIVINAMKQCGRLDLPEMVIMPPLRMWETMPQPAYFGDVNEAPLFSHVWKKEKRTCFFVGPESGFSDEEVEFLKEQGVKGVKLHPNILRTDTAPLMALSLISHWLF